MRWPLIGQPQSITCRRYGDFSVRTLYICEHLPQGLARLDKASKDPNSYRSHLLQNALSVFDYLQGVDGERDLALTSGASPKMLEAAISNMRV